MTLLYRQTDKFSAKIYLGTRRLITLFISDSVFNKSLNIPFVFSKMDYLEKGLKKLNNKKCIRNNI